MEGYGHKIGYGVICSGLARRLAEVEKSEFDRGNG